MNFRSGVWGCICGALLASTSFAAPAGYNLVWQDEFDGDSLDRTKWNYRRLGPRVDGINIEDAVTVSNGQLAITTSTDGTNYYTGQIATEGLFEPTFGYWEANIQVVGEAGQWCAFWLQSPTMGQIIGNPAESGAEIDIMEHSGAWHNGAGDWIQHMVHWDGYDQGIHKNSGHTIQWPNVNEGFHTFGVEWTEDKYTFYIDGVRTSSVTQGISHRGEYAILSVEVGTWGGDIAQATLPASMYVDYVRYYAVPEPSMAMLSLLGLFGFRRRR